MGNPVADFALLTMLGLLLIWGIVKTINMAHRGWLR